MMKEGRPQPRDSPFLSLALSLCQRWMTENGVNQFIRATWVAVQSVGEEGGGRGVATDSVQPFPAPRCKIFFGAH